MTRLTLVAAILIAAAVTQTQAASARHVAPPRGTTETMADCVRAPAEGAYASAPYTKPPCLPNTMTY
ncbi:MULTISPECIES: hypothetical protein [Bradyrhizobium]|uniref:hypothetical protein n=1 Tax=Bradyrhizobium TaxID=374 RepID=UPI001BA49F4C|nr:hypothetical protein [Bradyrhizobium liaoningense]MBR0987873.1 hypothetical protein [Bradyrhizobium liaoningense]GMO96507.1 hypothetical protein TM239_12200 [Bradyrhizobium sp. TM239]